MQRAHPGVPHTSFLGLCKLVTGSDDSLNLLLVQLSTRTSILYTYIIHVLIIVKIISHLTMILWGCRDSYTTLTLCSLYNVKCSR